MLWLTRSLADKNISVDFYMPKTKQNPSSDKKNLKIIENGKYIYNSSANDLTFTSAYLYLQMSSHSNYPSREIYFDNVAVREI